MNHLQFLKPIENKIEPQRKEKLLPSIKLKKKTLIKQNQENDCQMKWIQSKYVRTQSQPIQVQMLEDRPSSPAQSVMFLLVSWCSPLWVDE